jgi:hypothetical protein
MQNTNPTNDDKELMKWIKYNPSLTCIDLRNKNISDIGVESLMQHRTSLIANVCHDLWKQLDSGKRVVRGEALWSIKEFVMKPNLITVYLSNTQIGDMGATLLANGSPNLTLIRLDSTQVGNEGATAFGNKCKQLTDIFMSYTQVGDEGVRALANGCPKLTWLGLINCNQVSDESVMVLANKCKQLKHIFIHRTQVTECAAQALADACPKTCVYI